MRWTERTRVLGRSLLFLVACVIGAGCDPRAPSPGPPPSPPPSPAPIGPAPLRRLSNAEYLNALADLFPDLSLSPDQLPALPAGCP